MKNLLIVLCLFSVVLGSVPAKKGRRIHIPFLGLGPYCHGCPDHFCDDDLAIIKGYCCGCARIFDNLPVKCSNSIRCPLNGYELCQDYEYMMYCCCNM